MPFSLRHSRLARIGLGLAAGLLALSDETRAKACRMKNPDVSVFGITLNDAVSAAKQVGSGAELIEGGEDLPRARFVSKNGVEELVLYTHYGSGPDEYAEAEVGLAGTEALALKELPTETFITGRGIALGMSPSEVITRFGKCAKGHERRGDDETIQYEIDDADRDPNLKGYGYPEYYAEYEFRDGKLVRFRFGFEYP